jgi:hypothetical protein
MDEKLPLFPAVTPSSIKKTRSYAVIDEDLKSREDAEALAEGMFQDPDATFYYYRPKDGPARSSETRADVSAPVLLGSAGICWNEMTEFFFYQHHNERDFVRIAPRPGNGFRWDWQREYVETRPQFVRHRLKLSAPKRRELESMERTPEVVMGDKWEFHGSQIGAAGPNAQANGLIQNQSGQASMAVTRAEAAKAGKRGIGQYTLKIGKWLLETIARIGTEIAVAIFKGSHGPK